MLTSSPADAFAPEQQRYHLHSREHRNINAWVVLIMGGNVEQLIGLPQSIKLCMSTELAATYLTPSIRVGGSAGLSAAHHVGHGNSAHPSCGWDGPGHLFDEPGRLLTPVICVLMAPPL